MEILDSPHIPRLIREPIYISLAFTQKIAGLDHIMRHHVFKELIRLKTQNLVELGAGCGDNLKILAHQSKKNDLHFLLTDKFPSLKIWKKRTAKYKNLDARAMPLSFENILDLTNDENNKQKTFLIVSASHHMSDAILKKFIADCAKLKAHIIIIEPLERKFSHAFLAAFGSFFGLLTPFTKQLSIADRCQQAFIFYSGIGLFIQSFDGIISTLRQRSAKDFSQLNEPAFFTIRQTKNLGRFSTFVMTTFELTSIPVGV